MRSKSSSSKINRADKGLAVKIKIAQIRVEFGVLREAVSIHSKYVLL